MAHREGIPPKAFLATLLHFVARRGLAVQWPDSSLQLDSNRTALGPESYSLPGLPSTFPCLVHLLPSLQTRPLPTPTPTPDPQAGTPPVYLATDNVSINMTSYFLEKDSEWSSKCSCPLSTFFRWMGGCGTFFKMLAMLCSPEQAPPAAPGLESMLGQSPKLCPERTPVVSPAGLLPPAAVLRASEPEDQQAEKDSHPQSSQHLESSSESRSAPHTFRLTWVYSLRTHRCGSDSIPGPGTSICHGAAVKKKKKKKKKGKGKGKSPSMTISKSFKTVEEQKYLQQYLFIHLLLSSKALSLEFLLWHTRIGSVSEPQVPFLPGSVG